VRTKIGILLILALLGVLIGTSVLFGGCASTAGGTPTTQTPVITNTTPAQAPTTEMPGIKDVTVEEADALVRANLDNKDFVVLDVRAPMEYDQGHILRSVILDYNSPTFRDELGKLDKNKTYLLY